MEAGSPIDGASAPARKRRRRRGGRSRPREPKRRLRFGNGLPAVTDGRTHFSKTKQERLRRLSAAEMTKLVMRTFAFRSIVGPELDAIDATDHPGRSCRRRAYSAWELESILLYGRICAATSTKQCLKELASDQQGRRLLGFTRQRVPRKVGLRTRHTNLPGETTLSVFLNRRWDEEARRDAYRQLELALRDELLRLPELEEESLSLYLDGFCIDTHYTAPIYDPETKAIVNADKITAPTAGYGGRKSDSNPKGGHGWHVVTVMTTRGTVLVHETGPRNVSEMTLALRVIERLRREVLPRLGGRKIRVLTADGGFSSPQIREALQKAGILANTHYASHADKESARRNAEKRNRDRIPLVDGGVNPSYANWFANGHRELVCACGAGRSERAVELGKRGLSSRVKGRCEKCGNVSITAGQWRLSQNPRKFVPTQPGEEPDLSLGNPLTYNDPLAARYGNARFGHNEGFHGMLKTRFHFNSKRWFRRIEQAETDAAVVFSIIHTCALHVHEKSRRRRLRVPGQGDPP